MPTKAPLPAPQAKPKQSTPRPSENPTMTVQPQGNDLITGISSLQRTIGNQAVQRLIEKRTSGKLVQAEFDVAALKAVNAELYGKLLAKAGEGWESMKVERLKLLAAHTANGQQLLDLLTGTATPAAQFPKLAQMLQKAGSFDNFKLLWGVAGSFANLEILIEISTDVAKLKEILALIKPKVADLPALQEVVTKAGGIDNVKTLWGLYANLDGLKSLLKLAADGPQAIRLLGKGVDGAAVVNLLTTAKGTYAAAFYTAATDQELVIDAHLVKADWDKSTFPDEIASIIRHFKLHGAELGAADIAAFSAHGPDIWAKRTPANSGPNAMGDGIRVRLADLRGGNFTHAGKIFTIWKD